ncbi:MULTISPECIES: hypothetical protein [Flavobacterium]|uniref:hypothetical protein n=1 Tax=Flavobacterium TaxID=237 RepID=UPI0011826F2F|nr:MULTISPECIES: hypothetical protein [Flavobacterium]MCR4031013.1 hypothetical protein [Flavobacterium panacis]
MKKTIASDEKSGLECPVCRFKIKFNMMDLLMKKSIVCPSCNLTMNMDVPEDMKRHLQEISLAEQFTGKSQSFDKKLKG